MTTIDPNATIRENAVRRVQAWGELARNVLGTEAYDREVLPYVDALLADITNRKAAIAFSGAVTTLCDPRWYDADTKTWMDDNAKNVWTLGNRLRDGLLKAAAGNQWDQPEYVDRAPVT